MNFIKNTKASKLNRGMTYVELIVVLFIFGVMSTIVMYSYGDFQAKVDIKNLASDIALKIVEAQKSSLSGNLPKDGAPYSTWKPSYGVHFSRAESQKFVYFANLDNGNADNSFNPAIDSGVENIITKNYYIKNLRCSGSEFTTLDIVFRRPDSQALMPCNVAEIVVSGPSGAQARILIYPSGKIQIN